MTAEEAAADAVIDLYDRHAEAWAQARGASLNAEEAPHISRFMQAVAPGGDVLDLGCGAGRPVASTLIKGGFRVTGVDAAPSLIAMCRRDFPDQTWIVGDMRRLALGRRFDGVVAWWSSFHLTADAQADMADAYARHLNPGGVVTFVGGPKRGVSLGRWMGRDLHHASLDPEEYRHGLQRAGFEAVERRPMTPDGNDGAWVWTARRKTSD